ncbi:hypothetical protein Mgra_00004804 [Meloidogyne graminicola]|uniref:Uncharacterized protein n=1 Tax=Meloidogyne graminicola TaxID=189291 RepID=A0A8S9ZR50_9BILA|nr:hypothetical protein Mgra_00004804 [Meloidogyne graminicola]
MSNNVTTTTTGSGHISRKASGPSQHIDFVSADVNEILQDAREILTNKEHREKHPNERILDESTSVKVTKTGGDEDPMEITVLRQRLLERDEEDGGETFVVSDDREGWSSDTDLVSPPPRARLPSLHKCSHDNKKVQSSVNLPEEMTNERHMNVIYRRRRKEDLWQRDDLVSTGKEISDEFISTTDERGREDDAQLKVEITEHCRTEISGAHLIQQTWEATWSVQTFHSLPDWLQDNDFLHTGHRPPLPSFAACFKSIWSLHTETGNIWTHLIGCLAFFFLAIWFLTRPETHIKFQEKLVFSFFAGAILCLGLSFTFHTVSCHSKHVVRIFSRLDYMGISLLIVGSFIPWIYYGFYCRIEPKISYISMIGVLGLSAIVVSLWDKFNDKRYRPMRAGIFSFMGCSGVVPTLHFAYTDGMNRLIEDNSFYWLLAMAVLYLSGVLLYATRTPERFFPGKCDLLFQSHQLFHLCVVCGAFAHYYGIFNMAMKRLTSTCGHHDTVVIQHNEL